MPSDLQGILRRLKPEKLRTPLVRRTSAELPFLETARKLPRKLLYDTSVYIDRLQGTMPRSSDHLLIAIEAWHCTVTEAELSVAFGALDPLDRRSAVALRQLRGAIEKRLPHRTVAPDQIAWIEAGILSGLISRLQAFGKEERRKLLLDALIFRTARKHGLTVLTRNTRDFDFLQQLDPAGQVLFYEKI